MHKMDPMATSHGTQGIKARERTRVLSRDRVGQSDAPTQARRGGRHGGFHERHALLKVGGTTSERPLRFPSQRVGLGATDFAGRRVDVALKFSASLLARIGMGIRLVAFLIDVSKGYRLYGVSR